MTHYTEKKFNIPELKGISRKTVEEHLKLYAGYVKNVNLIYNKLAEYMEDSEKHALALAELQRRFSFEWNGMRNHEFYFAALEDGPQALSEGGALKAAIAAEFGSFENWLATFKAIALMRGVGWAMLYFDKKAGGENGAGGKLVHAWVEEQHIGQLNGAQLILGLDMWEHSYYLDYTPAEKKKYIEAFFENLNWSVVEENFANASKN
ncbi:MAG: Fe-Mn family superoxide dismutase [Patescibacteria group bacterium]